MSRITALPGDTYDRISRRVYGSPAGAGRIRAANPGLNEPLQPGVSVYAPPDPATQTGRRQPLPSVSVDEVALLIDGRRFRFWDAMTITRTIDAPDSVSFSSPFDPSNPEMRRVFRPFSYPSAVVTVGGDPLVTGRLVDPSPSVSPSAVTIDASVYASPGLLQDVTAPASAWPVEYDGLDLRQVAERACEPFGVGVVFDGVSPGAVFGRVAQWSWETEGQSMDSGQTVWAFLADLAQQRGLVMGSDVAGNLVFRRSAPSGSPVARLVQGDPPIVGVSPAFRGQEYYTHVTAVAPARTGQEGGQYTAASPFAADVLRPHTFEASDTEGGDLPAAADAKLARVIGNTASWSVDVVGWRTPDGDLWEPNTTLTLDAPGAMVYGEYEFLIREVQLSRDADSQTASLELVMPGALSGEMPGSLPWD